MELMLPVKPSISAYAAPIGLAFYHPSEFLDSSLLSGGVDAFPLVLLLECVRTQLQTKSQY